MNYGTNGDANRYWKRILQSFSNFQTRYHNRDDRTISNETEATTMLNEGGTKDINVNSNIFNYNFSIKTQNFYINWRRPKAIAQREKRNW